MEVQARLNTRIRFADVGTKIPHSQYMISSDCSFARFSQREIYGTVELVLVDHWTGAAGLHHILDHPHKGIVQFTRYLLIIDCISYSLQESSNTKCNQTLTNTPVLLPSILFSIPFDFFASVVEIVLVECLKWRTLITRP
jgi:hypothetical protein